MQYLQKTTGMVLLCCAAGWLTTSAIWAAPAEKKLAHSEVEVVIQAPRDIVWKKLTDFDNYPRLFPRVKSCQVIKRESDSVYVETLLKPQMFVKQARQKTVTDLGGNPGTLRWRMLEGNFKSATGEWKLSECERGRACRARYTVDVDTGAVIPRPLASMVVTMVQKEIVSGVKQSIEADYKEVSCRPW